MRLLKNYRSVVPLAMSVAIVAGVWVCPRPSPGGTIIFHSDANPKDADAIAWEALLTGAGHTVTWRNDLTTLDAAKIAQMEAADLVFISRDTNSGDYVNDSGEVSQWNGITTPLILASQYLTRGAGSQIRWKWVDNGTTNNSASGTLVADDPGHAIFANVTLDGSDQVAVAGGGVPSVQVGTTNGTVLGSDTNGRGMVVVWDAGTAFYPGSGQTPGGKRMFFCAPQGPGSLNANGQQVFLDAVTFMIPEPATFALAAVGLLGLRRRRRA